MRFRNRRSVAALVAIAAAIAFPSGVLAYRAYRDYTRRASMADFTFDPADPELGWAERARAMAPSGDEEDGIEIDDPRWRMLLYKATWGDPTPGALAQKARIARQEAEKWADLMPSTAPAPSSAVSPSAGGMVPASGPIASGTALSWVNLGPTDAAFEWNASTYNQVDSGRAAGILVDPSDATGGTVYFATSGGGVWKTTNFGGTPTWIPITETLGNIAIGAMDLDTLQPQTLHVGVGDAFDEPGGQMVKTTNGGASWSAPVSLSGSYPPGSGSFAADAKSVRAVKVDPTSSNNVLVATDVGLFRSTDGGNSYALVDLPNAGSPQLAEATWSIAYAGVTSGQTRWVVSGLYACAQGMAPPKPGYAVPAGTNIPGTTTPCTGGNLGDLWLSTDSGATWSSLRVSGGLPNLVVSRLTVAAGTPKADPATTVLYVQAEILNESTAGNQGAGIWRSINGGSTFVDATGTLANPTAKVGGVRDCGTVNVNDAQAWYNSTLSVDPGNDANVLVGGMLCGLRTLSGTAGSPSWENISHWLPSGGGGNVTGGTLPYVHADWHRSLVARIGSTIRAFGGTDGGLFYADNLFTGTVTPPNVSWAFQNRGLVTHLAYSVATGDPANGNPAIAFTGLQDNGTRFRDSAANPTTFNQVIGGDGLGTAITYDSGTSTSVYYGSVYGTNRRRRCVPGSGNAYCNQGGAWTAVGDPSVTCAGVTEGEPFVTRYAVSRTSTAPHTVLTSTYYGIYKTTGTAGTFSTIGNCLNPGTGTVQVRNIDAADNYDGLYGAALSGSYFAVTSNCPGTTTACTWTTTSRIGVDLNTNGTLEDNERIAYTSSMSFPPGPTGRPLGKDFVAVSQAPVMIDLSPLNPAVGLIFKTTDGGTTWTPLHGNGTGYDLPLVPINVVRYDPSDTTNNTLYVGTDLGVYRTTDGGLTWRRFGYGLPLVRVTGMMVGRNGQILRISTYGRGVWEIYPSATAEHGVNGDGDYDRNLQLDFIDLAAMASRLGTTPVTAAQPLYDWNMDVTTEAPPNNYNAINDNDLTLFLSRFGGRP